jgi:hypothetical protein
MTEPTWNLLAWQGVAALMTLAIFSFLLGDNPVYKLAERFWVGITTGYWTMLLYHTSFNDKVWVPIVQHHQWHYLIPTAMGILMWFRLSPKWGWVSRFALAFYIGISTGVFIPLAFKTGIFLQVEGTIRPLTASTAGLNYLLSLIGLICSLAYFFFSKPHTGAYAAVSRIGIFTLMIGFGAGFGLTVMGRVALLVQRVVFLRDYVTNLAAKVF